MNCPGFEQLLDFVDGRLAPAAAAQVVSHASGNCNQCEADLAWYGRVKLVAASDDSAAPPPWVLKRALRVFDAGRSPARVARAARHAGKIVASLVFDSLRRPNLAMARSVGAEDRQLMYQAERYSIDLQVALLDQSHAELTGQILREGELMFESVAGLSLDLVKEGGTVLSTVTGDRGEFRVYALDLGKYDLKIEARELSITIVGLPVG
jgi:hypothetical protein